MKRKLLTFISLILMLSFITSSVFADDGTILKRNVSKTPEWETEHAALKMLPVYVPAQSSDGTLLEDVEAYRINNNGKLVMVREVIENDQPVEKAILRFVE